MFIKQVIIQGFRSYGKHIVLDDVHPQYNVVVGRNGSGKSNFFYAIQFVLSDEFSVLTLEQRQRLLNISAGARVTSAFVEIVFDNTDRKLAIDSDEINLRRVISYKNDRYFLNRTITPRSQVVHLLESAGFVRSNPFYIVKQGKINEIALAPDSHRLKLLKEIAGTKIYDARRQESLIKLQKCQDQLVRAGDYFLAIDERLVTLEKESKELKHYQQYAKEQRYIQYILYKATIEKTNEQLKSIDNLCAESKGKKKKLLSEIRLIEREIEKKTIAYQAKEEIFNIDKNTRVKMIDKRQQLMDKAVEVDGTICDLELEIENVDEKKLKAHVDLAKLDGIIIERKQKLKNLTLQYENSKTEENACSRELTLKEQRRKELYVKQARCLEFKNNKTERDNWIKRELARLNEHINICELQNKLIDDSTINAEKEAELETEIEKRQKLLDELRQTIDNRDKQLYELRQKKDNFSAKRKEQFREECELRQKLRDVKADLAKVDSSLRKRVGKDILDGNDSLRQVLKTLSEQSATNHEVNNYYGRLMDNLVPFDGLDLAVEAAAGNRLFNHIITTEPFGRKILQEINKQQLPGVVTFLPFDCSHNPEINYPDGRDAFPLMSKLNYDEKFAGVLKSIFGNTIVCRDLEIAAKMARETKFTCVTLDGDQASKNSLIGGYFDPNESILILDKNRKKLRENKTTLDNKLTNLHQEIHEAGQSITSNINQIYKVEMKNINTKDFYEIKKEEYKSLKEDLEAMEKNRKPNEKSLAQCKINLEIYRTKKRNLENELSEDLMSQLSIEEQSEIDVLYKQIIILTKRNKELFSKRSDVEVAVDQIKYFLNDKLYPRKEELKEIIQEVISEERRQQLKVANEQRKNIERQLIEINDEIKVIGDRITEALITKEKLRVEMEEPTATLNDKKESLKSIEYELEMRENRLNKIQETIDDCQEKITNLGPLPNPDKYKKYDNMRVSELAQENNKIKKLLKNYNNLNLEALEQFETVNDNKIILAKQMDVLERDNIKITELLNVLERRKHEVVQLTFQQVGKYFSKIFKELVPSGQAQLVVKTIDGGENDIAMAPVDTDKIIGIGIKVSYTGQETMRGINQLSGGQKTLVALALIFAIQRYQPAPFYLFDEIDQALDVEHRKAVANMIKQLSANAQFITTTFRSEFLQHADKFYGVKYHNKVSYIECVTRDEAADFIEHEDAATV